MLVVSLDKALSHFSFQLNLTNFKERYLFASGLLLNNRNGNR